jgi:hypothetical protein
MRGRLRGLAARIKRITPPGFYFASAAVLGVVVTITVIDLSMPVDRTIIPLFVAAPAIFSVARLTTRQYLWLGGTTLAVALPVSINRYEARPAIVISTLIGLAIVLPLGFVSNDALRRQQRTEADLRAVANAVQQVVLRQPPPHVAHVRTEARYLAAAAEAHVGGDMYSAVATPYGVRLLIGDVMGHGLRFVKMASDVLNAFEQLAIHEPKLAGLALRLNMAVSHPGIRRDFVTALLVTVPAGDEPAELVCCGHPPPLLLRGTDASFVDLLPPSPPLGLLDLRQGWCETSMVPLRPGDQLLMYTDGVSEARNAAGHFYPLPERAAALHTKSDPAVFLDALQDDILAYCGGHLQDDAALLLAQRTVGTGERAYEHRLIARPGERLRGHNVRPGF